jgi:hypothetical protein
MEGGLRLDGWCVFLLSTRWVGSTHTIPVLALQYFGRPSLTLPYFSVASLYVCSIRQQGWGGGGGWRHTLKAACMALRLLFFAFIRFILLGICLLPFGGWHD